MFLVIALIASLVLFETDIGFRYGGEERAMFYQPIAWLIVLLNGWLLLSGASGRLWARRIDGWFPSATGVSQGRSIRTAFFWIIVAAGALIVARCMWFAVGHVFRQPADVQSGTSAVALLVEAANRLAEGQSAYREVYDMGGWTTRLTAMPGLVWLGQFVNTLGFDIRLTGALALAGTGAIGAVGAAGMAARWKNGLCGLSGAASALLLLGGTALWCLGRTSQTFVYREPGALLWLVMGFLGLAIGRKAWISAAFLIAMGSALKLPLVFVVPVLLCGIYGWNRLSDSAGSSVRSHVPNVPLVVVLVVFTGSLIPSAAELGAVALGVVEQAFNSAAYYADAGLLGKQPGVVYLLSMAGLAPLLPVVFIVVIGELSNAARRGREDDPGSTLRLVGLGLFATAALAPLPYNTTYWPYLGYLVGAAVSHVGLDSRLDGPSGTASVKAAQGRTSRLVAIAMAALIVATMGIRVWAIPRVIPLNNRAASEEWTGKDLLKSGFHSSEGEQVWMNGTRAVINLPFTCRQDGSLQLRLSVVGSKTREKDTLTVELNGATVYSAPLPVGTLNEVEFEVDRHQVVIGSNTLVLGAEWADSPAAMGLGGTDTRTLSFGFYGLRWQPKSSR